MRTPILLFAIMHFVSKLQLDLNAETKVYPPIQVHLKKNAYYAQANNKRIGVRIMDRIYLNRCMPFLDVSLWVTYKQKHGDKEIHNPEYHLAGGCCGQAAPVLWDKTPRSHSRTHPQINDTGAITGKYKA